MADTGNSTEPTSRKPWGNKSSTLRATWHPIFNLSPGIGGYIISEHVAKNRSVFCDSAKNIQNISYNRTRMKCTFAWGRSFGWNCRKFHYLFILFDEDRSIVYPPLNSQRTLRDKHSHQSFLTCCSLQAITKFSKHFGGRFFSCRDL